MIAARVRRAGRAAVLAFVLLCAGVSTPASAAQFGMSDGRPILFDSPHLHALNFQHVRLVLPWDAARRDGDWWLWLDRARLQGFQVLVAPSIDDAHDCEKGSCTGPSVAEYSAALRELLARAPAVTAVEAWNEPNHALQPTSRSAALAAAYFDAAYAACAGRCTAVAGNMLDGPSLNGYVDAYRAALKTTPAVWGIHNYFDATYFQRSGLDKILSVTDGPVWLTETGGLVSFRTASSALPYDEHRAADSLRWLFTLAVQTPRIERAYLYGMWQQSWNPFDSALLRQDNTERESMQVVRAYVGKRVVRLPGEQAPKLDAPYIAAAAEDPPGVVSPGGVSPAGGRSPGAEPGAPGGVADVTATVGRLRVAGKRVQVGRSRRVSILVRCLGPAACRGRIKVVAGRWKYSRGIELAPLATKRVRTRIPKRWLPRVNPRLSKGRSAYVQLCDAGRACPRSSRQKLRRR